VNLYQKYRDDGSQEKVPPGGPDAEAEGIENRPVGQIIGKKAYVISQAHKGISFPENPEVKIKKTQVKSVAQGRYHNTENDEHCGKHEEEWQQFALLKGYGF
jgi:hypothetical protein